MSTPDPSLSDLFAEEGVTRHLPSVVDALTPEPDFERFLARATPLQRQGHDALQGVGLALPASADRLDFSLAPASL
ncbi:hypothetical protein [Thiohalorhabdus methylotrophus]|uniref:Uncharacterized protein n=1 Tax=Thiohalorhabdus methylotrophus TaxID=3242694 RepID=A0ABV4U103_9GAMM